MKIFEKNQLRHQQLKNQKSGELYSLSQVISDFFGSTQIFLAHDIIVPGHRASSAHRHSSIEEVVYITKGELSIFCGEQKMTAREGSFIFFDPNEMELHYLLNETESHAETLTFSINRQGDRVIYESHI